MFFFFKKGNHILSRALLIQKKKKKKKVGMHGGFKPMYSRLEDTELNHQTIWDNSIVVVFDKDIYVYNLILKMKLFMLYLPVFESCL